jgi:hypothetical protein
MSFNLWKATCASFYDSTESLTIVSASDPLLSEAAYWMMDSDATFKAAETLKSCLDGYAIHKGDHGELLVMLLFTLARDRAIGHPKNTVGLIPDDGGTRSLTS